MKINNHIILDFNKTKQVDTQTIQCDMNSRFVRVSLRHNNSPIDLSDVRVCIMAVKPDGKEIFNDCTVIDAQNGIAEFEITKQMGIVVGEVECQIKLFGPNQLLSSNIFRLSVRKTLSPSSKSSQDQLNTLVNALGELQDIDNRFAQTNARLSDIENKIINRKFKPKFGTSTQWGGWKNGGSTVTLERMKNDVDKWIEIGFEELSVTIHTSMVDNAPIISENLDLIMHGVDYAISEGLDIKCVKLHCNEFRQAIVESQANVTMLSNAWLDIITTVGNLFKTKTNLFVVINEGGPIFERESLVNFVVNSLRRAKSLGFKAGITPASLNGWRKLSSDIVAELDFYSLNFYPSIGTKGLDTTVEEVESVISNTGILRWINECKRQDDNKEVIITETGCADYEVALLEPWIWTWGDGQDVTNNGKVQALMMEGVFKTLETSKLDSLLWWFDLEGNESKKIVKRYVGGENIE
jgi:hypothetical protein